MPIRTQSDLPAKEILERENIFVMDENRAIHQDIRPINIVILNLMPLKEDTELQILRSLSNTPLQVDVSFMAPASHASTHTSKSHLNQFYQTFDEIRQKYFDGLIITGAPVEQMEYEEVDYWEEVCKIMEWSKKHVTSTLHLCWGAQAGLYYHYGIKKHLLPEKLSGIYTHKVLVPHHKLMRGFDDTFTIPHSRHTGIDEEALKRCRGLEVLAVSEIAGSCVICSRNGRQVFVTGHAEYDRDTLAKEYFRDKNRGLNPNVPYNYFPNDDASKTPPMIWRSNATLLYTNWLNYFVYQATPYDLRELINRYPH